MYILHIFSDFYLQNNENYLKKRCEELGKGTFLDYYSFNDYIYFLENENKRLKVENKKMENVENTLHQMNNILTKHTVFLERLMTKLFPLQNMLNIFPIQNMEALEKVEKELSNIPESEMVRIFNN